MRLVRRHTQLWGRCQQCSVGGKSESARSIYHTQLEEGDTLTVRVRRHRALGVDGRQGGRG
eukprot:scaffold193993_cov35-Tisochrysis_lutea.AAC.2